MTKVCDCQEECQWEPGVTKCKDTIMNIDFNALMAIVDRRDFLCRHVPFCPKCDTQEVQMMDAHIPAQWKCRKCRHCFEHEPIV